MSISCVTPQDCSLCEEKTVQVCSKCKEMYFCSRDCQKLVWPVHKFLCGKDRSTFFFPPLSEEERLEVDLIRDRPLVDNDGRCAGDLQTEVKGATLFEQIQSLGLFHGGWEDFLESITAGDSLMEEPRLSMCLVLVRAKLDANRSALHLRRPGRKLELGDAIFNDLGRIFAPLISCRDSREHLATFESNPLLRFSALLHKMLIVSTNLITIRERGKLLYPRLQLAYRRLLKEKPVLLDSPALVFDPLTKKELDNLFEALKVLDDSGDLPVGVFEKAFLAVTKRGV
ncbi:hypothetical protein JCM3765_005596 [Sporobolomyces pararoseus]